MKRSIDEWVVISEKIKGNGKVGEVLGDEEVRTLVLQSINSKLIGYKMRKKNQLAIKLLQTKHPKEYEEIESKFK